MEAVNRIKLIQKLLQVAQIEEESNHPSAGQTTGGKCIWYDLDGNKRCNSWTEGQARQVYGRFYPGKNN